jgi:dihydrofolate synthase / folylpolyglutamate synthase
VNYDEALRFLEAHVNLEARAGRTEGLSLERMREVASLMGEPQSAYPVIHVTGTNGKGSTVLMITELLKARGLRVGTYLSPHVERINERIRLDGEPLDDDRFAEAVADVARLEPLLTDRLSYFESLTAAAFALFAAEAVDVAVVEVGLLGRWDATNIVDADVAVITNIGRDHTDGEGEWRTRIAEEKAGIISPRSTLVLGETSPDLRGVFLRERPAKVIERNREFACTANEVAVGGRLVDLRSPHRTYEDVFVSLHGEHQGDNAAIALAAVEAFFDAPLEDDVVAEALGAISIPGRFEVMRRDPLVVIDAAHNPDGARTAATTFDQSFGGSRSRILVVGMLSGRDPGEMLDAIDADRAELVILCAPDWPRAVPATVLGEVARAKGIAHEVVPDVEDAVHRALAVATDDDAILVSGSFYVVGAARRLLHALAD